MRRLKRYILNSLATAGALLLAGCASDAPDVPVVAPDDAPFYLTFELAAPTASTSAPAHAPATRGDNNTRADIGKRTDESTINSVIAYVVDAEGTDTGKIAGVAYGDKVTIGTLQNGKRTVTLNMGLSTLYTRKHKYRVYVLANMPQVNTLTKGIVGQEISLVNNLSLNICNTSYSSPLNTTPCLLPVNLSNVGLPFSTTTEDAAKVQIWLEEKNDDGSVGDYSTPETAYIVKADTGNTDDDGNPNSKEEDATLSLTPLYARFDFVYKSGKTDFLYPIEYKTGEETQTTVTEAKVLFKKARILGAARDVYTTLQNVSGSETVFKSPSTTLTTKQSGVSPDFVIKHSVAGSSTAGQDNPGIYVPEYIPTVSGTADNYTMLKYQQVTYLELDALLVADADCTALNADVKDAINKTGKYASTAANALPALYYYDDGKFQSTLTTNAPEKTNNQLPAHWKEIKYKSTEGGYVVTYRHAIRHSDNNGAWKDDDGKIYPMEYGVVRNHLYQIGINSVSSLPHAADPSDPIESPNKDINIQILTPTKWYYHRGGFELVFE